MRSDIVSASCLVVRHVDHRHAEALVKPAHLELHLLAQLLVERAERLVHQHELRLEHERTRHRDALLLAARQLGRPPGAEPARAAPCRAPFRRGARSRRPPRRAPTAETRCCRQRSCAGTARSSGTPCRSRAGAAAASTSACPPAGSRPRSALRSRRASSASSSCPSPKVPAASGTRRARCRGRDRRPPAQGHRRSCRCRRSARSGRASARASQTLWPPLIGISAPVTYDARSEHRK